MANLTENITSTTTKFLVGASKVCWDFTAKQTKNLVYSACKSVTNKIEAKQAVEDHQNNMATSQEEQRIKELLKEQKKES